MSKVFVKNTNNETIPILRHLNQLKRSIQKLTPEGNISVHLLSPNSDFEYFASLDLFQNKVNYVVLHDCPLQHIPNSEVLFYGERALVLSSKDFNFIFYYLEPKAYSSVIEDIYELFEENPDEIYIHPDLFLY